MPTATTEGKVNEIRTACLVIVDTKTSFDTHNSVVKTNFMALFLLKMTTKQIKFSAVFYICPRKKRAVCQKDGYSCDAAITVYTFDFLDNVCF